MVCAMLTARLLLTTVLVLLTVPVGASADQEPGNDLLGGAEGPIAADGVVTGSLSGKGAGGDLSDWYVLYTSGVAQISVAPESRFPSCVRVNLMGADGGDPLELPYTVGPGYQQWFFRLIVDGFCWNDSTSWEYKVVLSPSSAIAAGAPMQAATPLMEPNETPQTASGPLLGDVWYGGVLETTNDRDFATFFVAPGLHHLDVQVTSGARGRNSTCDEASSPGVKLSEDVTVAGSSSSGAATASVYEISHIRRTVQGPKQMWISTDPGERWHLGCPWQVRISPGGAVSPNLVPVPAPATLPAASPPRAKTSKACLRARARIKSAGKRAAKYRRVYRRSRGSKRVRYYAKYRTARRQLNAAYRDRRVHCPNGR
jgi:hypothetical protein